MDSKSIRFNNELAARIGVQHLESLHEVDGVAKQIVGVINRRERIARLPQNVMNDAVIENSLFGVYNDIYRVLSVKAQTMLEKSSRSMLDLLASALDSFSITESKRTINKTIFPGIPKEQIRSIILNRNIPERILKRLQKSGMSPKVVSNLIKIQADPLRRSAMVSQYFQTMRTQAYTISRTSMSGMVSQVSKMAFNSLPNDLVGFQVHGILDDRIRPAHRERNGTIYYKKPRYGNAGFDQMPNPPLEADGSVAHNCRCWLTPVLNLRAEKFYDFKGRIIPSPRIFNDWFNGSPKSRQVLAVGVKRHAEATKRLAKGEELRWEHLLNPVTGMLLDASEIKSETENARAKRIKDAKKIIRGT